MYVTLIRKHEAQIRRNLIEPFDNDGFKSPEITPHTFEDIHTKLGKMNIKRKIMKNIYHNLVSCTSMVLRFPFLRIQLALIYILLFQKEN